MAETLAPEKPTPPAAPKAPVNPHLDISGMTDHDLCTCLYNYGTTAAKGKQRLGGIKGIVTFTDGIARNVSFAVAQAWLKGVDTEGKKLPYAPKVIVVRREATEADFAEACGIDTAVAASPARTAAALKAMSVDQLIDLLGEEDTRVLADAIYTHFGLHAATAFASSTSKRR